MAQATFHSGRTPAMITVSVPEKAREMAALMADEAFRTRIADDIAERMYGVNATFPEKMTGAELRKLPMVRDLFRMLENNLAHVGQVSRYINPAFLGIRGFGKTKLPKQFIEVLSETFEGMGLLKIDVIVCPMQLFSMDSMSVPMRSTLEDGTPVADTKLVGALARPGTLKVLLADEVVRATKQGANAALGLIGTGLIAGTQVEGYLGTIGTGNNTREDGATSFPDYAFQRRFRTRYVNSSSAPYFRHLADLDPELDLNPLMSWYYGPEVTETMRETLNARTLRKILIANKLGNPLITALPIVSKGPARIEKERRTSGEGGNVKIVREDVTYDTLATVSRLIGHSGTTEMTDPVRRSIDQAIDHRLNLVIYGESAAGKTSIVQERVRARGFIPFTFSVADSDPENLVIMAADQIEQEIELLAVRALLEQKELVLILEEINRGGSKQILDRVMEITGERALAGRPLPIRTIIALGNRNTVSGSTMTHNVRQMDHAQADRFDISIELRAGDIDSHTWLRGVFGAVAEPVLTWYDEDLPAEVRGSVITPDVVKNLCQIIDLGDFDEEDLKQGFVGDWATGTFYGEEYLPRLMVRLKDLAVARLSDLVRQADCPGGCDHGEAAGNTHCDLPVDQAGITCRLGHGLAELQVHGLFSAALQTASLDLIKSHWQTLLPMMSRLEPQSKMPLITWHEEERRMLLQNLALESRGLQDYAA